MIKLWSVAQDFLNRNSHKQSMLRWNQETQQVQFGLWTNGKTTTLPILPMVNQVLPYPTGFQFYPSWVCHQWVQPSIVNLKRVSGVRRSLQILVICDVYANCNTRRTWSAWWLGAKFMQHWNSQTVQGKFNVFVVEQAAELFPPKLYTTLDEVWWSHIGHHWLAMRNGFDFDWACSTDVGCIHGNLSMWDNLSSKCLTFWLQMKTAKLESVPVTATNQFSYSRLGMTTRKHITKQR